MKFDRLVCIPALALCLAGTQLSAYAAPAKTSAPSPAAVEMEIPVSVFKVATNPSEGRNPFYPKSTLGKPVPAPVTPQEAPKVEVVDTTSLVLNGITSPPKRTAMINGRTFEQGEEGEVKLPNGSKMLLKVVEIHDETAIVQVNGNGRRELRLRSGV